MYYTLYGILMLTMNPTISTDLKSLGDSQYLIREATTKRLETLPGWTALFFQHRAEKAKDLEVRTRCERVYRKLDLKWKVDLILSLFPNIPADIKALGNRQSNKVHEIATKKLESLPGLTALYFKYNAATTADPLERSRCDKLYRMLDIKWRSTLADLYVSFQWEIGLINERRKFDKSLATIFTNLSKLNAEDLKAVEAQKFCPIHDPGDIPVTLGAMGVPVKIRLNGQVVFLCCKDHVKKAQSNPDKTLAEVKEVKKIGSLTLKQLEEKLKQMSDSSEDK